MMAAASEGTIALSEEDMVVSHGDAQSQGGTDRAENDQNSRHGSCEADHSSTIKPIQGRKRGKKKDITAQQLLQVVMEKLRNCRVFLLKEQGPLSFVVRGEDEHKPSRVTLSSLPPSKCCTCKKDKFGVCLHIVFVLIRVFQLEEDNPVLVNQTLSERELQHLTDNRERLARERRQRQQEQQEHAQHQKEKQETIDANPMTVCKGSRPVRKLDPDEVCPICQIDIIPEEFLTFCHSCEKHAHVKCMKAWAEHRNSHNEAVTCPLCRHEWGEAPEVLRKLQEDLKEKSRKKPKNVHFGSVCMECKTKPLYGSRYRCIECEGADLCSRCFHRCRHKGHAIIYKERPGNSGWLPAPRDCDETSNMQPLPESLQEMEHREITHEDYERLLELDRINTSPELYQYLANCLQKWNSKDETRLRTAATRFGEQKCVHCSMTIRTESKDSGCCVFPCYHLVHKNCLEDLFREKTYKCPCTSCQHRPIFPGLIFNTDVPDNRKQKPSDSPTNSDKENCGDNSSKCNTENQGLSLDIRGASIAASQEENISAHSVTAKPPPAAKNKAREKQRQGNVVRSRRWQPKGEGRSSAASEALPSLITVRGSSTASQRVTTKPSTARHLPPKKLERRERKHRNEGEETGAEPDIQGIICANQLTSVPRRQTAPTRKPSTQFSEASGNKGTKVLPPLHIGSGNLKRSSEGTHDNQAQGILCISGQQV